MVNIQPLWEILTKVPTERVMPWLSPILSPLLSMRWPFRFREPAPSETLESSRATTEMSSSQFPINMGSGADTPSASTTGRSLPDPLISSQNIQYSMSTYIVTDVPVTGYTVTEAKQIVDALTAYLTASTGAKVTQLLGGEN